MQSTHQMADLHFLSPTDVGYIKQEEEEGGYEVAAKRNADLDEFYSACAQMLNCDQDEVAFVESASRGWALAFYSLKLSPGDRIITSAADYGSNFVSYLQARDRYGAEVVVIDDDAGGELDLLMLRREAGHARAKVICMSHIPTGGGRVIPAEQVGAIAKEFGLAYMLDACQSVGMMKVLSTRHSTRLFAKFFAKLSIRLSTSQ